MNARPHNAFGPLARFTLKAVDKFGNAHESFQPAFPKRFTFERQAVVLVMRDFVRSNRRAGLTVIRVKED